MKVSVCVITYNQEKFIAQTIESVMMQETNFDYELVIGEDCSIDRTYDICAAYQEKYPDRIRVLRREKNLGVTQNFVETLYACRGQYVATLGGDDYWTSPNKLQKQADFLDTHPDYAICFTQTMCFYEDNSHEPVYSPPLEYQKNTSIEDLLRGNYIVACSVMFRNGLFHSFPDWFFSSRVEDWALHILNAQHGKVGYINEAMAAYRIHANSTYSSLSHIEKMLIDIDFYRVINAHLDFKYRHLIGEMVALRYQVISSQYLLKNDTANARHYVLKSIRSLPLRRYFAKRGIIIGLLWLRVFCHSGH